MELWIRSQDRTKLCRPMDLHVVTINSGNEYGITSFTEIGGDIELALYPTKERALEVLDEIQGRITSNEALRAMFPKVAYIEGCEEEYGKLFRDMVYQMPKE